MATCGLPLRRADAAVSARAATPLLLVRRSSQLDAFGGSRSPWRTGSLDAYQLDSAPVVPVAILGSHKVRNWKRLEFPRVTVQWGEPFRFAVVEHPSSERRRLVADYILDPIRELHAELERPGHTAARSATRAAALGWRAAVTQVRDRPRAGGSGTPRPGSRE